MYNKLLQGCLDEASTQTIGVIGVQVAFCKQPKIRIIISDDLKTFATSIYLDVENAHLLQQSITDAIYDLELSRLRKTYPHQSGQPA